MAKAKTKIKPQIIEEPSRFINRELSWLDFNRRVLSEAGNPLNPLLERAKFLAIFESNLDEFYMVRVSGLVEQHDAGVVEETPDGLSPSEQLAAIQKSAVPMRQGASTLFESEIRPQLAQHGINILSYSQLTTKQKDTLATLFETDVFPVCTPLILSPNPSVPFISNRSLNFAVELKGLNGEYRLARVKLPTIVPRLVRISPRRNDFVLLEEVVKNNLQVLFPGIEILGAHLFRVIRDADVEIRELEAADLISYAEETLRRRRFGDPIRLDVELGMPKQVRDLLLKLLELTKGDVFELPGTLGFEFLWELTTLDIPKEKFRPFQPYLVDKVADSSKLFQAIKQQDILVHQPFDSFRSVEAFVSSAANDPNVIGIKQTLYRVGTESPIVESLLEAAEDGKQVAAMVELKARFDESNNITWAKALERGGAHVTYGFRDLKTHAKLSLIVRREPSGLMTYAHIGTGNYNPATAKLYTDFGLFTCDQEICQDIAELFNYLTGFSDQTQYRQLLVAPHNLRDQIIEKIEREVQMVKANKPAAICFKRNSLVDPEVIEALYAASTAGVKVDLIVRGICCLRPHVAGMSDNIRVISIVGRFLEHSRAYYFENGGDPELYIGSADLMRRNLDRRIEVLAPVRDPKLIRALKEKVLDVCLKDTVKAWVLNPTGEYKRIQPSKPAEKFSSHEWFVENPLSRFVFETSKTIS